MLYIYSYANDCASMRAVANELKATVIAHTNSKFVGRMDKLVLNWGSSDLPREVRKCRVLNTERSVMDTVDKLRAFQTFKRDTSVVPWTTSPVIAQKWANDGQTVYCRTRTKGKDGEGLVVIPGAPRGGRIVDAKLYTRGIQAEKEYRVTVVDGHVVGYQRKVPLDYHPNPNPLVKTTAGGYGFKYVILNIPDAVTTYAIKAVKELGLNFGGVDIIWDGRQAYVLEVNTAPQLTPQLVRNFTNKIKELYLNEAREP